MNDQRPNNTIDRALTEIKAIRMTAAERENMKEKLSGMIAVKIAAGPTAASQLEETGSASSNSVKSPFGGWSAVMLTLVLIILVGGGLAAAAEKTLPGDALYPVKVNLVEPIVGAFWGTGSTFASWQANLVSERLGEAETLASAGKLNDEKRAKLEKLLDSHTIAFVAAIDEVEKTESPEMARGIYSSLRNTVIEHAKRLNNITVLASTSTENREATAKLKNKAAAHADNLRASWTLPVPVMEAPDLINENTNGTTTEPGAGLPPAPTVPKEPL